jgi:hypothetical protein
LARLSHSTTRLLVPLSREFNIALLNSVRFHLKLYGIARPAASYSLAALGQVMEGISSRNGARGNAAQLILRASGSKLRMTLRPPAGLIATARLKALLPSPPPGVQVSLKAGKGGQVLTLEAPIPGRD